MKNKLLLTDATRILTDREYIAINIAIYFSLIVSLCAVGLCYALIPNKTDLSYLADIVIPFIAENSKPERAENFAYLSFIISFPITYLIAIYFIDKKNLFQNKSNKFLRNINIVNILLIIIIFISMMFGNMNYNHSGVDRYYHTFTLFGNMIFDLPVYIIATIATFVFIFYLSTHHKIEKVINTLIIAIGVFFVFYLAIMYITPNHYDLDFHVEAYIYPIIKLLSGQIPLIDFTSIYGLYPYFYYLPFKIFGFTEMNFSIFIAMQIFIIYAIFFYFLYTNCKNKFIALFGFLAIIFLNRYILFGLQPNFYLQYLPHRVLFPMILLFLLTLYQQVDSIYKKRIIYFISLLISVLAIFWNIDSGAIVYIAFILFFIFLNLQKYALNEKILYFNILKHLLISLLTLIIFCVAFYFFTYFISGEFIDFATAFYGISIFRQSGFFMIALPTPHIWYLHIFILLIALVKGLNSIKFLNFRSDESNSKSAIYFLLSILGFGLFLYFQGRSHVYVFIAVVYLSIIPLSLLGDGYYIRWSDKNNRNIYSSDFIKSFLVMLLLLSFSIVAVVYTYKSWDNYKAIRNNTYLVQNPMVEILSTVKKYNDRDGKYDLLILNASIIYHRLGIKYDLPLPAVIDLYLWSDIDKSIDYIGMTENNVLIQKSHYDLLIMRNKAKITDILNKQFFPAESSNDMLFYKKRYK